ncbi:MAG: PspC domain-containing protein, partial [Pseudomonadota bacterium]
MRPVIRVSLNGHARQLEDDAHALLTQYLDAAARTLDGNPDRAEILADLERSIAEKSARFLVGGREVLERAQIALVLDEIGPVEPASNGAAADATSTRGPAETGGAGPATGPAPARLRQISDGAMISGLCNGIAAWAGLDVTIVRIVAVVLAFATGGAAIFVYLLLMFIVPYASGPAASHALPRASRSLVEKLRGQTAE